MSKFICIGIILAYTSLAQAGTATGKITTIEVADDSIAVLFMLSSALEDTPRCNEAKRFAINLRKPGGVASYMALLEAKRKEYVISIEGLNTCGNEWKSEDVKRIIIN